MSPCKMLSAEYHPVFDISHNDFFFGWAVNMANLRWSTLMGRLSQSPLFYQICCNDIFIARPSFQTSYLTILTLSEQMSQRHCFGKCFIIFQWYLWQLHTTFLRCYDSNFRFVFWVHWIISQHWLETKSGKPINYSSQGWLSLINHNFPTKSQWYIVIVCWVLNDF